MSPTVKTKFQCATSARIPSGRGGLNQRVVKADTPLIVSSEPYAVQDRHMRAATNADYYEWQTFRRELLGMAQRPMTLAEAGARLLRASSRVSGLLGDGDERFPFTSFVGGGGNRRVTPDLLPLPVPTFPEARVAQLDEMYPTDQPPTVAVTQFRSFSTEPNVGCPFSFTV